MSKDKTLCEWDRRKIEKKLADVVRLIEKPHYVCRKCARAANQPQNLCKPVSIDKSK